jgi:1-deoxy-D-xylulose-5-phosphate reductoisomerase
MKSIAVLGSTGSIGCSALDAVAPFPDRFRVVALAAGRSIEKLARQIATHRPVLVSVERSEDVSRLERLLPAALRVRIVSGASGLEEVASHPEADTVVGGLVGALGLRSAFAAVAAGKRLALANKEPLVVGGELLLSEARRTGAEILPVDSEHSAIHQAMRCGSRQEVSRLVLTASGGPFLRRELSTFSSITVEDALAHPTWRMGPKITVDSATLMNKGLEVIEAHFLFGLPSEDIGVVIHPQSTVHSFVEFVDGSVVAQLSRNDMRFPILYALSYPERLPNELPRLDLTAPSRLEFEPVDSRRYPALGLARAALLAGGAAPAVLNAANELAVDAFLEGKIPFPDIVAVVSEAGSSVGGLPAAASLEEAEELDRTARRVAAQVLGKRAGTVAAGR